MERSEPTLIPEWLKSSGSISTITHQFASSSLHSDDQGVSKSVRNKSSVNNSDNDLGRPSVSDRTTSSYFRRNSGSNGSTPLRSYSSFGRNHRDRDWDKDIYDFRDKEKTDSRHRDFNDPLGNILPSRFEKDGLRRSYSSVSGKRGDSWTRKVAADSSNANKNSHNNGSALASVGSSISNVKTAFERDFPSLGADEKHTEHEIGRVPSPGLSTAIQSLPTGTSAVIGGDGWTSALAEVPVIVGSNGSSVCVQQSIQPTSASSTISVTTGRNMAETLAQGPPRAQTAPQLSAGTQRLEELAVKQSRQLIPMTPSMPKALALNSSEKPKPKVGQLQLQSSHLVNQSHSPRAVSVKPDVTKASKLQVLKPSRERNGLSPAVKESLSPTGSGKLPNSPLAVPSVVGPAPVRNPGNSTPLALAERKPIATLEKRPSSQAQSRNDFFNSVRKKSMTTNSSAVVPDSGSPVSADKAGESDVPPAPQGVHDPVVVDGSLKVQQSSENNVELTCNGGAHVGIEVSASSSSNGSRYSEEEETKFMRSLGWTEAAGDEPLTQEEINSFLSKYMNALEMFRASPRNIVMPLHSQMGSNGDISSDSQLDS